jgi:ATP-dependent helicase IRC3
LKTEGCQSGQAASRGGESCHEAVNQDINFTSAITVPLSNQEITMETFTDSTQRTISLRPYQREALAAIADAESRGIRRQLVSLPTGTGKTVIFAHLLQQRSERALVLAHRDELIEQAASKILTVDPAASVGICKAERNELHREIVIASVQTLSRESRLSKIDTGGFTTVIVDEAHHAAADSYRQILDHFHCFAEDGPLTVGFTATPERADEKALGEVFSNIVYRQDILTMMRAGYLCDLRAIQVSLEADFNKLHSRHGDFIDSEASDMLMAANAPAHAVTAYREHAPGRKALLFTPTIDFAHYMADAFNAQGIRAEALSGETPVEERRAILRRLKSGATRIVANCAVLTEGFDEPSIDCVIVARPTRSKPLYIQMIGRGTRIHPGKNDCLILDLVGVTTRHDLMTTASLFAVNPKPNQTIAQAAGEREAADRLHEEQEAAQGRLISQAVDLFRRRRFNWLRAGENRFVLSIGKGMIVLTPDENGWTASFNSREGMVELATGRPLDWAQGISEDYAREMNAAHLIDPQAPWRMRPATEKQLSTLKRFRIHTLPNISAGEASDLIAQAIGRIA